MNENANSHDYVEEEDEEEGGGRGVEDDDDHTVGDGEESGVEREEEQP